MTRVSENSSTASVSHAINQAKTKLENLQLKGSSLSRIVRPSDDPIGNVEALSIISVSADNDQFLRNSSFALTQLNVTEKALDSLSEIVNKAKELAISQSSDFYDADIRKNVANEVVQLRNQALAIANKRIGNRYIFSGHSTLTAPFNSDGEYKGDKGKINLEVSKDFFVPINLDGEEVFYTTDLSSKNDQGIDSLINPNLLNEDAKPQERSLASINPNLSDESAAHTRGNIFSELTGLITALENNDSKVVQGLLEKFDDSLSRLITLRTRIGSLTNSIDTSQNTLETEMVDNAERKSKLVDADVAELFSDIQRQQQVLQTAYKSSQGLMNKSLLDFMR